MGHAWFAIEIKSITFKIPNQSKNQTIANFCQIFSNIYLIFYQLLNGSVKIIKWIEANMDLVCIVSILKLYLLKEYNLTCIFEPDSFLFSK